MLVHERFREAADTLRRMNDMTCRDVPMVPGSSWPDIIRSYAESYGRDAPQLPLVRPSPGEIDRLDEVVAWANDWLEDDERKLVWGRAWRVRWKSLAHKLGCGRTKVWEIWTMALIKIAAKLNLSH